MTSSLISLSLATCCSSKRLSQIAEISDEYIDRLRVASACRGFVSRKEEGYDILIKAMFVFSEAFPDGAPNRHGPPLPPAGAWGRPQAPGRSGEPPER